MTAPPAFPARSRWSSALIAVFFTCHRVPTRPEIDRYYPPEYGMYATPMAEEEDPFFRGLRQYDFDRRCDAVLKYKKGGSVLDVGAGIGDFLAAMRDRGGWEVRGVEPSLVAAKRARAVYNLDIDIARLDEVSYPPESFDAVTLWEVLEHVPQPREALCKIFEILMSGSVAVMSIPNRDSIDARLFGPGWIGLDIPRHFSVSVAPTSRRRSTKRASTGPKSSRCVGAWEPAITVSYSTSSVR